MFCLLIDYYIVPADRLGLISRHFSSSIKIELQVKTASHPHSTSPLPPSLHQTANFSPSFLFSDPSYISDGELKFS